MNAQRHRCIVSVQRDPEVSLRLSERYAGKVLRTHRAARPKDIGLSISVQISFEIIAKPRTSLVALTQLGIEELPEQQQPHLPLKPCPS